MGKWMLKQVQHDDEKPMIYEGGMTDVITSDSVASVSLDDAGRDPQAFADELGQSFVD